MSKLIRKSVRMSPELAEWVDKEAERRGVSQSGLITNIVHEYARQDKAMISLDELKGIIKQNKED